MIKVRLRKGRNKGEYILLGTGYGIARTSQKGSLFDFKVREGDTQRVVALCDYEGNIHWAESKNVQVISVDGKYLDELL